MGRLWLMLGCLFSLITVAAGAFGAHMLQGTMDARAIALYDTATDYMMFHSVGLLVLGLWSHWEKWASSLWAGLSLTIGILLFSGSLYALALTDISGLAYLTPAGGVLFLLGWIQFFYSVMTTRGEFI